MTAPGEVSTATAAPAGELELVLFHRGPEDVRRALAAGIGSLLVDLEWRGKERRQAGADTEINRGWPRDLLPLAEAGVPRRYCRLDRAGPWTAGQVEDTLAAGATHLLLPMVQRPAEAEALLRRVDGRAACGILVETTEAVAAAPELGRLPLDLVYVGLNDLAIARRTDLFTAFADGTVESVRGAFPEARFGVAGVTVVDGGTPVPSRLLLAEMARLGVDFSFLRRSFHRDVAGGAAGCREKGSRDWARETERIQDLWRRLTDRSGDEIDRDRRDLLRAVAP